MDPAIFNWSMVLFRGAAMFSILPVFSATHIPVRIRLALAALLAWFVSPQLGTPPAGAGDLLGLVGMVALETGTGLALGFVARLLFFALDAVGAIITSEMGLSLHNSVNLMSPTPGTTPGTLLNYLAAVMWLSFDLHHWMLIGFRRTYDLVPIGGAGISEATLVDIIQRTSGTFLIALQMTAPILAVSFIVSLVFSILSRAVPQMNVFSESMSIRAMSILAAFGMTVQLMGQHLLNYLNRLPEDFLKVAQLLGS
jgi:flagellar biosynthetic protein FliR